MPVNILVAVKNGLASSPAIVDAPLPACWIVILWLLPGRQLDSPWILSLNRRLLFWAHSALTLTRFPPSLYSLLHWLLHQTACAAFSRYNWLQPERAEVPFGVWHKSLVPPSPWMYVCIDTRVRTCSIRFQRILDSITQPIKDHLFPSANLIRPCRHLKVFLPVSHSVEGPLCQSVAKARPSC